MKKFWKVFGITVLILLCLAIAFGQASKVYTLLAKKAIIDDSLRVGGPVTVNGSLTVSGTTTSTGAVAGTTTLTPVSIASATTLQLTAGTIFYVSGTAKITRILPVSATAYGTKVTLVSVSTDSLIDGGNLKLAGNFNGTADDVITLIYGAQADTFFYEESRAIN